MIFTPRIDEAIKLASRLHRSQNRNDGEKTPYISHLMSVAILVSSVTDDEDVIIAGLMHDALEDVPRYSYENLIEDCGKRVADIVSHVTEPLDANKTEDEQLPWLKRKEAYLQVLRNGDATSALVSCADKIHNTESFLHDFKQEGETYAKRFNSSIANRIWFHDQAYLIIEEKLGHDHALVMRFRNAMDSLRKVSAV